MTPTPPLQPALLLTIRVADVAPGRWIPPGLARGVCGTCKEEVFVSAASRELVVAGKLRPVCRRCLPAGPIVLATTREHEAELATYRRQAIERN